jgi:hypothetical protein
MAKRFKGFSAATEQWVQDVNTSVRRFHTYAMERDKAISREEFIQIF